MAGPESAPTCNRCGEDVECEECAHRRVQREAAAELARLGYGVTCQGEYYDPDHYRPQF